MRVYIDSDVLIWHLRGKKKAFNLLRRLSNNKEFDLWTGALQRAEVVFFMRADEVDATNLFLSRFETAPVDAEIVDVAGALYRQWHPSHNIDVNDAFLAATAMKTGGKIVTLNIKHFPMTDLVVDKAW
jgi:hypothetical protein